MTPSSGNTTAPITSWPRTGAGTGALAVGMVACCAHHLADLLPLLGTAGVTGFLFDWRILLMIAGLGINLVAVTVAVRADPRHDGVGVVRRLRCAAVIGVAVLALAACSNDDAPVAAAGLPQPEVAAGDVTVTITPTRIDAEGAEFAGAFDTHSVDLDLDVDANAELTVDGTAWTDPVSDGAGPGGHHRQGTLRFAAHGPASGDASLTIGGLDQPVTASWTLRDGG